MNKEDSMIGRWDYTKTGNIKYGHVESYRRAAAWFDEIGGTVEDWGCGPCAFEPHLKVCNYRGIDGSYTQSVDVICADLQDYGSLDADHILLRDVLDHNLNWRRILQNAIGCFKRRMLLNFFHWWAPETKVIVINTVDWAPGVPDLVFKREDIMELIYPYFVKEEHMPADAETVNNNVLVYLQKK